MKTREKRNKNKNVTLYIKEETGPIFTVEPIVYVGLLGCNAM
jgi:hypothetical protein